MIVAILKEYYRRKKIQGYGQEMRNLFNAAEVSFQTFHLIIFKTIRANHTFN